MNIIGVAVLDAISFPLERYPEPLRRPQVVTQSVRMCPGGGAVNTAATLAQLGIRVRVFTKVGNDQNGRFIVDTLAGYGVETRYIVIADNESTPFTFVGVHPDGERTFIHTPGSNLMFAPEEIDREALIDCSVLLYPDLHVLPRLDGDLAYSLLTSAQAAGVVTAVDECWGLGPRRELFEQVAKSADVLMPSADDLSSIYAETGSVLDPENLAQKLLRLGPSAVILKLGAAGSLVAARSSCQRVSPAEATIIDTTGAGDAFNAGFIVGLLRSGVTRAEYLRNVEPDLLVHAAQLGSQVAAARLGTIGGSSQIRSLDRLGEPYKP